MEDSNGGRVVFGTETDEAFKALVRETLETSEFIETDELDDDEFVFYQPEDIDDE